jgi:succinoglycan biosynthesis transport protein ExoP
MNIQQLFLALRARPGIFGLVLAVTVLTTLIVSLLLPKSYVATVSLLLDSKDEQSFSGANVLPAFLHQQQQAAYMQTQTDIIRSYKVVHKVLRDLGLANSPEARQEFEEATGGAGSFENWLADRLLKYLSVETTQSSVVQIGYTANDARMAAQIANAFARPTSIRRSSCG